MKDIKKIPFIAMIVMTVVSFSNLFGLKIAGLSVFIGVVFFFLNNVYEKQQSADSGLDIKTIKEELFS